MPFDERSFDDPLYKDVSEYFCATYSDDKPLYHFNYFEFWSYNQKNGSQFLRYGMERYDILDGERYPIDNEEYEEVWGVKLNKYGVRNGRFWLEYEDDSGTIFSHRFDPVSKIGITYRKDNPEEIFSRDICVDVTLPFHPTGESFSSYLNDEGMEWDAGKGTKYEFSYLDECYDGTGMISDYVEESRVHHSLNPINKPIPVREFRCNHGYVSITSPLEKMNCRLSSVYWRRSVITDQYMVDPLDYPEESPYSYLTTVQKIPSLDERTRYRFNTIECKSES